jgi:hypothetical protein
MPPAGRKPKPQGQAINRNKPVHEWTEVERIPFKTGPKLPTRRTNGRMWDPRTRAKWKAWSAMPHCMLWGPAEWDFAIDSIEIAALMHDGETKWATELRNRERVLGTTGDFLRDLRIRYIEPKQREAKGAAGVTNLADYRDL